MALGDFGARSVWGGSDSQGNVWFADNYYGTVTEISPAGATLQSFSVNAPRGIALHSLHGDYPFLERVNPMRFLPDSTYPLLMILGMT